MSTTSPLILHKLTKRYGSTLAVSDVSLQLNNGEVFGFLGPNGAGKSTTIRTILDFIRPTTGSVEIFGSDSVTASRQIKQQVGYLAGDIALYDRMTGHQLISYLSNLGKDTDWQLVKTLSDKLEAQLDRPIHALSKGNKQKIGLIQAFMHRPELIVLDEPTSGLDPLMKNVFYDMVKQMKADGKTVFVSSHDLAEVQKICDRAAFIRGGELIAIEKISAAHTIGLRRYTITLPKRPNKQLFSKIKSVVDVEVSGHQVTATVKGDVSEFVKELAKHKPVDLDELDVSLEETFLHYYKSEAQDE